MRIALFIPEKFIRGEIYYVLGLCGLYQTQPDYRSKLSARAVTTHAALTVA